MSDDLDIEVTEITKLRGILLKPQIIINFKVKNKLKDQSIIIENLKYDLRINISSWVPNLGGGFVFEKRELQPEQETTFESDFKIELSSILAINNRVLSRNDIQFEFYNLQCNYTKDDKLLSFRRSNLKYNLPWSNWNKWYKEWLDEFNRLKMEIGKDIITSTTKEIGLTFANQIKQDLESFMTSELIKIKSIQRKFSKIIDLLDFSKKKLGSFINEDWVLAVVSSCLLENVVNLKLKQLGLNTSGKFGARVSNLVSKIREIDGKEISSLGIKMEGKYTERSKILHSSHKNKVDEKLANDQFLFIKEVINTLWD